MLVVGEQAAQAYCASLTPFWHPLMRLEDVGEGPHACELLGRPLTVFRHRGRLACLDDVCRHFGASLSLGEVVGGGRTEDAVAKVRRKHELFLAVGEKGEQVLVASPAVES